MNADAPLDGYLVVELCQNVAGPYAGLVLGQLGARVIKIERPGSGDDTRSWTPPELEESPMFATMNAGKESLALDLTDQNDRRLLWAQLDDADVLLRSWRPGSLERFGFGWDALSERLPSLVCCSVSAFGPEGPKAEEPGYDPLIQAFSGLMSLTGHAGQEPVRVGTSVIDMATGMWAAMGVLGALMEREHTGRGIHVQTSLFEAGLAWLPYQLAAFVATGEEPAPLGSGHSLLVPYQAFPTATDPLVVAVGNDRLWRTLCSTIDRDDLAADPELATNPGRIAHRERLVTELRATFEHRPAAEWADLLGRAGVPSAVVNTVAQVVEHPQTHATGMLGGMQGSGFPSQGLPFTLAGERPRPGRGAPGLDEHGDAIRGQASIASRRDRQP